MLGNLNPQTQEFTINNGIGGDHRVGLMHYLAVRSRGNTPRINPG
jgi:hypothetical protein